MALTDSTVVRHTRFEDSNVFISALEPSTFLFIFLLTLNPQRFVRLLLVGEYVPNFFFLFVCFFFLRYRIRRSALLAYPE